MAKSRFYTSKESQGILDVIGSLGRTLPDDRPITAVSVVENTSKCPDGYFPVLKTYDEDSDADLWRQQPIFGKRTSRYICISKSEDVSSSKLTAIQISSIGDTPPFGYTTVSSTADTNKPAWRRRQLCYLLTADSTQEIFLTDIIVCSRLKKAPSGFSYAGEINGMTICYKTGGITSPLGCDTSLVPNILSSPNGDGLNYENVLYKTPTPEARKRAPPERPPKVSALVAELNKLNLQNDEHTNGNNNGIDNFTSGHDYEILNGAYNNMQPSRPAPPVPPAPTVPPRARLQHTNTYNTIGNWNPLEGVAFMLNPKLSGCVSNQPIPLPVIKKRTLFELDQHYSYNFLIERQT